MTFEIPVIYQQYGTYEIEADTLEQAKEKALDATSLPGNSSYIDDSMMIDDEKLAITYPDLVQQ